MGSRPAVSLHPAIPGGARRFPRSARRAELSVGSREGDGVTETLLDRLRKEGGLTPVYQPIVELGRRFPSVRAYEALVRGPQGTLLATPDVLFQVARERGEEAAVDRLCVETTIAGAASLGEADLSVNVHASTLAADQDLVPFLVDTALREGRALERLIVEIVEHAPVWDVVALRDNLQGLRDVGIRIALDDVGLGYSNFRMMLECRPDFFKLDRYFVRGVHQDFFRRSVVESVVLLAHRFGGRVVAEGIESEEDLAAVQALGVAYAQGFLFRAPGRAEDLGSGRAG